MTQYVFSVPVVGSDEQFPVRRVYCVGRNYAAHAREMGFDPDREPPFFFCKPADAVVPVAAGETLDCRIRRRPTTITTKLSWWWRLGRARYSAGAGA
jgi:2-keto-4-pentenoate hydratase/2-oxohepta-3-ene-1,7-dioic acid hydratase in catechol pathway